MALHALMDNAMAIAASGLMAAATRFGSAASNLANMEPGALSATSPAPPRPDFATQIVDMIEARTAFGASLVAFRAADRMTGTLLNLLA